MEKRETLYFDNCEVTVIHPDLTPEERELREQIMQDAAVSLIKAQDRAHMRTEKVADV